MLYSYNLCFGMEPSSELSVLKKSLNQLKGKMSDLHKKMDALHKILGEKAEKEKREKSEKEIYTEDQIWRIAENDHKDLDVAKKSAIKLVIISGQVDAIILSDMPSLKEIKIQPESHEHITAFDIKNCENLQIFDLTGCSKLMAGSLENIPNLLKLSLVGCSRIETLDLDKCKKLTEVDISSRKGGILVMITDCGALSHIFVSNANKKVKTGGDWSGSLVVK